MVIDINRPWLSLDKWQKEYINTLGDCFLLTPRQAGKTTAMSIKAVELCIKHYKKGEIVLINSLSERQAMLMLKKAQIYAEAKYPNKIDYSTSNKPTMHRLHFKNGTGVLCYAAGESGESTRGYTIKKLMVDEGSRLREEYFMAAIPTLAITKGSLDIASTPFGKRYKGGGENFFYRCSKDDNFKKFFINLEDIPRYDKEFIEKAKTRMSKLEFAQEFLGVFTDDLLRVFTDKLIDEICILQRNEVKIREGISKYLGVDVAGFGKDECTFEGIQKISNNEMEQIEHLIEKRNLTTDTSNRIIAFDWKTDYKKIGVDDGGIGFGVFSELLNNDRTKRKVEPLNNASRVLKKDQTKKLLKNEMYLNLLVLMENKRIKLFNIDEIKRSLESIQYDEEGKIIGHYSHIVEGLIRACWLATNDKTLNIWIY